MDLASITANIRVDADSRKGSVIDVVRLVNPNLTSSNAGNTLTYLQTWVYIETQLKINGKGKLTPVPGSWRSYTGENSVGTAR
jgi:hypothetical protein